MNTLDRYLQKFYVIVLRDLQSYIFSYEIVQEDLLAWNVYYRVHYGISFFILTHVLLDE